MDIVAPFIILMQGRPRRRILETTGQPASLVKSASFQVPVRDLSQKTEWTALEEKYPRLLSGLHSHAHTCMHTYTHMYACTHTHVPVHTCMINIYKLDVPQNATFCILHTPHGL